MNSRTAAFVISVLVFCCLASAQEPPRGTNATNTENQVVAIKTVIGQVQAALVNVQRKLAIGQLPPLKSVTLSLQTVATKSGGAKIKLWIVTFGKTWEKERLQEVNIVLTPPSPSRGQQPMTSTVAQQLEDAIVSASEGVSGVEGGGVPLSFSGLSVELAFVVTGTTGGGVGFEIVPVSADLSGELSRKAIHKILVVFEQQPTRESQFKK